ncbi:NAD(P)/FAD-dependent oxidoreductase [Rhodococcus opacus]|uniref:NAD(P)/FAD-dependent oxidoreductase n=1 Tax=Rhodococcus opacus TaxID=37919 RepID=UPI001C47E62A|nr:FAD-dependent oxidoreductase [Rhodococcus opacus]MBV6762303.1 FAD-dependent oxidoreductase [Rhodococcus opacus]
MTAPEAVVIVGESIAGITAARELRARGFAGRISMIGDDPHGGYSRPPLSKVVLKDEDSEAGIAYHTGDLALEVIRARATSLDTAGKKVFTEDGRAVSYDSLIAATGAAPRHLARPGQRGEMVLRTLDDARKLRARLDNAATALVIGAGFLGMEVASACLTRGVSVTVVDSQPPLQRILGPFISGQLAERAVERGMDVVLASGPVELVDDPVRGARLPDGRVIFADVVVTCAGDVPVTEWLADTGLADARGIPIDERCRTHVPDVYAAGDVAYLVPPAPAPAPAGRAPFWSNAVAQARVAACTVLGQDAPCTPRDDYFWTEIANLPLKVVGPLPVSGEPTSIEGSVPDGNALLRWDQPSGQSTVVAFGKRVPVGRLRAMAAKRPTQAPS